MKRALVVVVALLVGLSVASVLVVKRRTARFGTVLVQETTALAELKWTRPSHRPSAEVSDVNGCIKAVRTRAPKLGRLWEGTDELARVADGTEPVPSLPEQQRDAVEKSAPYFRELVACSRGAALAPTEGVSPMLGGEGTALASTMRTLDAFAPVLVRQLLERGDAAGALALCADSLAFGRDVAWDANHLLGAARHASALAPACAAAISSAPSDERERFARELELIRSNVPPVRTLLLETRLRSQVESLARPLPRELFGKLPSGAQHHAVTIDRSSLTNQVFYGARDTELREMEAAADEPEPARSAHLLAIKHRWTEFGVGPEEKALHTVEGAADFDTVLAMLVLAASETGVPVPPQVTVVREGAGAVLGTRLLGSGHRHRHLELRVSPAAP